MYYIASPEKHKAYRIGVARVEDGEGVDDPHDAPCLEDRVLTPDVEMTDHLSSEDNKDMSDGTAHLSDSYPRVSIPQEHKTEENILMWTSSCINHNSYSKMLMMKTIAIPNKRALQLCPKTSIIPGMPMWQSAKLRT